MQSQTEGRVGRTSAWEQTQGHAAPPREQCLPRSPALHHHFPSSFFVVPKSGVLLSSPLVFAFHCYRASANILLLWDGGLSREPSARSPEPSPHPSVSSALPPNPPSLLFDTTPAWLSGVLMLAAVGGRLKTLLVWGSWEAGRNQAASGEKGMRMWMDQFVPGAVPPRVLPRIRFTWSHEKQELKIRFKPGDKNRSLPHWQTPLQPMSRYLSTAIASHKLRNDGDKDAHHT